MVGVSILFSDFESGETRKLFDISSHNFSKVKLWNGILF